MNKKNQGAASVLVVFLMLVLVTLGAFSISSSNANFRLSQRALNWNRMYYGLDAQAEEYLAQIDTILAEAEARILFNAQLPDVRNNAEIPAELRNRLEPDLDKTDLFNYIFLYSANDLLQSVDFPGLSIFTFGNEPLIEGLLLDFTFASDHAGYENCYLHVSLWVNPALDYADDTTITWPGGSRYTISDWYEYQETEQLEPGAQLWDGKF